MARQDSSGLWPSNAKDWIALLGGLVGLVGGVAGLASALRPPKITAAHMDHVGVVVSTDRTTHKIHLPLVLTNVAKKPGAITLLALSMRPLGEGVAHEYEWGLFWKEDSQGNRTAERRPAPIPMPGYTCVERSVQFDSRQPVQWTFQSYQFTLTVRVGRRVRRKRVSTFYTRPSQQRIHAWYQGTPLQPAWVDDIPIFGTPGDIPEGGV
jgi:hypothetical protein